MRDKMSYFWVSVIKLDMPGPEQNSMADIDVNLMVSNSFWIYSRFFLFLIFLLSSCWLEAEVTWLSAVVLLFSLLIDKRLVSISDTYSISSSMLEFLLSSFFFLGEFSSSFPFSLSVLILNCLKIFRDGLIMPFIWQ